MKTKQIIALAAIVLFGRALVAQQGNDFYFNEQQQNSIRSSLESRYSGVDFNSIEWQMNSKGGFDGLFTYDARQLKATFEQDGTWVQTSEEVVLEDLPENLRNSLEANAGQMQISRIERVETSDSQVFYDVMFHGREPVRFDESGNEVAEERDF